MEITKSYHRTTRNNISSTLVAVSKLRWYRQFPPLAYAHIQKTLIPTFNNLSYTKLESKRLISIQTATRKKNNLTLNYIIKCQLKICFFGQMDFFLYLKMQGICKYCLLNYCVCVCSFIYTLSSIAMHRHIPIKHFAKIDEQTRVCEKIFFYTIEIFCLYVNTYHYVCFKKIL